MFKSEMELSANFYSISTRFSDSFKVIQPAVPFSSLSPYTLFS